MQLTTEQVIEIAKAWVKAQHLIFAASLGELPAGRMLADLANEGAGQ